jgi:mono/diheme cytochrome c family protein
MRYCFVSLACAVLAGVILQSPWSLAQDKKDAADQAEKGPAYAKEIRPLLKTYCFECHSSLKKKAGLDLEKIGNDADAVNWPEVWDQVGERVRAKEMPPAKSKQQPTGEDRKKILAWVEHVAKAQVSCDILTKDQVEKSTAGYTRSRRLSRMEYGNTLRDLFGVDLQAAELLPSEGGGGEGFDNAGGTLFTTPVLMEAYLQAAELVLAGLLPEGEGDGKEKIENYVDAVKLVAARNKLLVLAGGAQMPRERASKILNGVLPRAFRRPVTEKETERYLAIFDKAEKRGDSFKQALKLALKGVLISPSFLFLVETPPDMEGAYRLGQYEIATHLSYFLWASMPDDELFKLAAAGRLHEDKVLREQVGRMMHDSRARSLADSFAAQWLGIRPLGVTIRPDSKLFPEFNEELAAAMREETLLFFDAIVREDRSVLEILGADYTFLNERLAALYKIRGVEGAQMRRVKLEDSLRGGVLGQASILTVTSFPHRTSPVLRGRWILEELLGTEVPPPPPDVPVLNEKDKGAKALTLRQQLEKHRSKPECAACHSKIDPLGFGLENFDPLGRWRSDQGGKPVDSVGVLPSGEKFEGPAELKKLLLEKRRPEFLRNFSRKMLGYALGREVNKVDMCVVGDCVKALEEGEFRIARLLETIVVSHPFLHRYNLAHLPDKPAPFDPNLNR